MACTVAVETVIVDHYNDQLRTLMQDPDIDKEILETITKFRDEEQEHHDTGIDHGAEQAPFYKALTEVIKAGCKAAIALSKEVWLVQRRREIKIYDIKNLFIYWQRECRWFMIFIFLLFMSMQYLNIVRHFKQPSDKMAANK